jgi:NAD(P)-dependent dehydrogenase (short-subunit alcohol dehydrogenase family)
MTETLPTDDADGDGEADLPAEQEGAFAGPVAIVTGASRGIGRWIADALEDAGYAVARGSTTVAPVTDPAAVTAWVGDVLERHGRIDLLVNNAGVIDTEVDLLDSDSEQWWAVFEVNVLGVYLMTREVGRHFRAEGRGRVVNLNSGAAFRRGSVATAYNASKAALAQLTTATHLGGIPALDLMPGIVRTDMTASMDAHVDRTEWTDPADVTELVVAFAAGELDEWSGRFMRAGLDTPASLRARAALGLDDLDRTLGLHRWGEDDPVR